MCRSPSDFFDQPTAAKPSWPAQDLAGNSDDAAVEDHDRTILYQDAWASSQDEDDGASQHLPRNLPAHCPLDDRVGLGVAGMLRRVGLDAIIQAKEGKIVVTSQALTNWLRECSRSAHPSIEWLPCCILHCFQAVTWLMHLAMQDVCLMQSTLWNARC